MRAPGPGSPGRSAARLLAAREATGGLSSVASGLASDGAASEGGKAPPNSGYWPSFGQAFPRGDYLALPTDDGAVVHGSPAASESWEGWRRRAKLVLEDPSSSRLASLIQFGLISLIFFSVMCAVLETVPTLRGSSVFFFSEPIFTVMFSAEIAVRFWTVGSARVFFTEPFNLIDILATVPGYFDLIFLPTRSADDTHRKAQSELDSLWTLRIVRVVRMVRLLRVLRLAKAEAITVVVESVRGAASGLYVLVVFVFLGSVVAATASYLVEVEVPKSAFTSIPVSFWWAITTIVGVGYGDMIPQTFLGKVIGILTMLGGTTILAVCIAVITTSFMETYQRNLCKARMRKLRCQPTKRVTPWYATDSAEHVRPADHSGAEASRRNIPKLARGQSWLSTLSESPADPASVGEWDLAKGGTENMAACVDELQDLTEFLILRCEALADKIGAELERKPGTQTAGRRYTSFIASSLREDSRLWFRQLRNFGEDLLEKIAAADDARDVAHDVAGPSICRD